MSNTPLRLIAIAAMASFLSLGQTGAGGGAIQGTVKDSSGAAIPRAKIAIIHLETGRVTNTQSNAEGFFATPPLSIGKYKVRVEAPGMKVWEGDLLLEAARTAEVSPVLAPGQVNEVITVTDAAPMVTTTDPTAGSTLDAQRIGELPINGRDMNTLLADVTPGVEEIIDVNGGVRTDGLMVYSTNYVQDGAASNNREFGGSMNLQGLESVGEVRMETSTSSAKYNAPSSVIVSTRGGGNRFRMAVYETMRNNAFGVARARQDVFYDGRPFQTPKLIRNEFGGSIGGPVILPSFGLNGRRIYNGRNRTFFFFSREGLELRQGLTRDFKTPTAAMRQGDFSGLYDSQGRFITLYDPLTTARITTASGRSVASRIPFIGNAIPAQRQSAISKRIWGITPMPTDITNPLVTSNLKVVVPTNHFPNTSADPTTVRLDHRVSSNDNFFIKFNGSHRTMHFIGTSGSTGAPTANMEANMTFLRMEALGGSFSWTHIFSPRFFVETSGNRTAQTSKTTTGPEDKDWAAELGLPNPRHEIGWPSILNVGFMSYVEGDNRRSLRTLVTNAEQNYSYIAGTHTVQFGWRYHKEKQTLLPDQGNISGTTYFNSLSTALESATSGSPTSPQTTSLTGNDAANFYLGYGGRFDVGLKRGFMHVTERNYGLYLQDNYKVTSRLTINPGLRWDINPAFTEENYQLNAFDVPSHSIMLPKPLDYYYKLGVTSPSVVEVYQRVGVKFSSAQELGKSEQIFQSNNFDIGPRFGFAYRAFEGRRSLVIRGGYGIYLSPIPMRTLLAQFSSMPPFRATYQYNPNSSAYSPDGIASYLLRNTPTVIAGSNSRDIIDLNNPAAVGRGVGVRGMGALPSMKIHEWNLMIEKQLRPTTVVRIRYNGKHGVHADQLNDMNPTVNNYLWYSTTNTPLPTGAYSSVARRPYDKEAYTDVRILEKTGYINTSTFSAEVQRRFSKGLGFQLFHTVTNSLRLAGNSFRDSIGTLPTAFMPGAVPSDPVELNRFLNYRRDTGIPKHRTRWNWNYDLPFGRGKLLGRNAGRHLNNIIGGWKLSGSGTIVSSWFALPTSQWGELGKVEVYGKKYPVLDCRGTPASARDPRDERCFEGYLYYNGYISQRYINSYNAAGLRNGVFGLPENYKPAAKPVNPWPAGGQPGQPGSSDWDTNNVYIPLQNGSVQRVAVDTALHPWRQQYLLGPLNWLTDASLLKYFSIAEGMRLRLNVDMFNVFNNQGLNTPGGDGVVTLKNSYSGFGFRPRQLQVTARLEW
ncbi:MAG: TonB-dependent receptor [Acidobacteria bacterium]|nr:TonB-dependent receptor [Acidobacteriota bacterium]